MAGPLDDDGKPSGSMSKRPTPTIEGTATEVSVDPPGGEASTEERAQAEPAEAEDDEGRTAHPGTAQETPHTQESQPAQGDGMARTGRVLSHLAAGLAGGIAAVTAVALAGDYLSVRDLFDGKPAQAELASLEQRLAKLEAARPDQADGEALARLEAQVKALEDRKPESPPELAQLAGRVTELETTMKTMAEAAKDSGSPADAAAIGQAVGEAEKRLQAQIDQALAEGTAASSASLEAVQKELAELEAKFGALAEAELGSADAAELGPEIAELEERMAQLEGMVPDLADAIDDDAADTKSATLAIAFANLKSAVGDGRPYATELATLAALSPGAGDLGGLIDYDDKGIPTVAQLTRSFRAAKDTALAASAPASSGSLLDNLLSSAASLVKIRRVDAEATGKDASAVLARAEAKLEQGDLAATVKEVETLQDPPRAAFADWLDKARARLGADETLQRLEGILLISMTDAEPRDDQRSQRDRQDKPHQN